VGIADRALEGGERCRVVNGAVVMYLTPPTVDPAKNSARANIECLQFALFLGCGRSGITTVESMSRRPNDDRPGSAHPLTAAAA
jgi:hypothetical protein